jgi:hypothetical protein
MKRASKPALVSVEPPALHLLFHAPELAALGTLHVVLEHTVDALHVANPGLFVQARFEGAERLSSQLWVAHQIVTAARPLQLALDHYRRIIENDAARRDLVLEYDCDIPF